MTMTVVKANLLGLNGGIQGLPLMTMIVIKVKLLQLEYEDWIWQDQNC